MPYALRVLRFSILNVALVAEAPLVTGIRTGLPAIESLLRFRSGPALRIFFRRTVVSSRKDPLMDDEGGLHIPSGHAVPARCMGPVAGKTHDIRIPFR